MKLKKFLTFSIMIVTICVSAVVFSACGSSKNTVKISGSSSVAPIMKKLASEYERLNKNVVIRIMANDSSTGIADTLKGSVDISMSSRSLKSEEKGLISTKICDDGVVMIANKENTLEDVTSDQIYNLFANGSAIGNINSAVSREEGSGTRDAFDGLIKNASGVKLSTVTRFSNCIGTQNSTGAVMVEIVSNVNTLGYISLGSLNDTVKPLKFDGIAASAENIKNSTYKLARPFLMLTKEGAAISALASNFMNFILSPAGQTIVTDSGYVSL